MPSTELDYGSFLINLAALKILAGSQELQHENSMALLMGIIPLI